MWKMVITATLACLAGCTSLLFLVNVPQKLCILDGSCTSGVFCAVLDGIQLDDPEIYYTCMYSRGKIQLSIRVLLQ